MNFIKADIFQLPVGTDIYIHRVNLAGYELLFGVGLIIYKSKYSSWADMKGKVWISWAKSVNQKHISLCLEKMMTLQKSNYKIFMNQSFGV